VRNITRYRLLEEIAEDLAAIEVTSKNLLNTVSSLKLRARSALAFRDELRNKRLGEARTKARDANARRAKLIRDEVLPMIDAAKKAGAMTQRQIADWLNKNGVSSPRGGMWSGGSVHRLVAASDKLHSTEGE
jgi:hypothetical protein